MSRVVGSRVSRGFGVTGAASVSGFLHPVPHPSPAVVDGSGGKQGDTKERLMSVRRVGLSPPGSWLSPGSLEEGPPGAASSLPLMMAVDGGHNHYSHGDNFKQSTRPLHAGQTLFHSFLPSFCPFVPQHPLPTREPREQTFRVGALVGPGESVRKMEGKAESERGWELCLPSPRHASKRYGNLNSSSLPSLSCSDYIIHGSSFASFPGCIFR